MLEVVKITMPDGSRWEMRVDDVLAQIDAAGLQIVGDHAAQLRALDVLNRILGWETLRALAIQVEPPPTPDYAQMWHEAKITVGVAEHYLIIGPRTGMAIGCCEGRYRDEVLHDEPWATFRQVDPAACPHCRAHTLE